MTVRWLVRTFLPHLREVNDEPQPIHLETKEKLDVTVDSISVDSSFDDYELRDEATRPWYKLFDEYEYRFSSKTRTTNNRKSKAEKVLLVKLHIMITLYLFVGYWVKYLDQANITNAYVLGMKEDLNMKGDDFINAQLTYNAGAVIFQFLFMYLMPRVPIHYLIGGSEFLWGFFTLAHYALRNVPQLYALRFLVGAGESGYYMLWHYCFSNWFLPDELGFVGGFYYCGQMLGVLTSGLLAGHTTSAFDGYGGLSGWRWLFIIDAIITVPTAILGFFIVPGTPTQCYSLILTDDEIKLARARLKRANITLTHTASIDSFFSWALWKRILSSWKIYVLAILDYFFWSSYTTNFGGLALWLKADKTYLVATLNRLTAIPPALGILFVLAINIGADVFRSRFFAIIISYIFNLIGCVILAIWTVPDLAKWFAFLLGYFGLTISSVIYGWINDIMRHDSQERAIVLLFCNLFSQLFRAWCDRLTFPTTEAPQYFKGYVFCLANTVATMLMACVTLYFYKRQERMDAKSNGILVYNSTENIPDEVTEILARRADESVLHEEEKKE